MSQSGVKNEYDMLHIGLDKCGSTFLQKNIFPYCNKKIYSSEELCCTEYRHGYYKRYGAIDYIKNDFGDIPIILVIRNKKEHLRSKYSQLVMEGKTELFDNWLIKIDNRMFDYNHYIDNLKKEFSFVKVYNLDELKNVDDFVKKFEKDFDLTCIGYKKANENKSPNDVHIAFRLIINNILRICKI